MPHVLALRMEQNHGLPRRKSYRAICALLGLGSPRPEHRVRACDFLTPYSTFILPLFTVYGGFCGIYMRK